MCRYLHNSVKFVIRVCCDRWVKCIFLVCLNIVLKNALYNMILFLWRRCSQNSIIRGEVDRGRYPITGIFLVNVLYRVSQEECARLREGVPYVKVYRYNPKHLRPKLNGYEDNGQRSLKL